MATTSLQQQDQEIRAKFEAARAGRKMVITYVSGDGAVSRRAITVVGIGADRVRAFCHTARGFRVFLFSGIEECEVSA